MHAYGNTHSVRQFLIVNCLPNGEWKPVSSITTDFLEITMWMRFY